MAWTPKDLIGILELNPELRAYFESFATKDQMQGFMTGLQEHESNKNIHVTREEKASWNGFINNLNNLTQQVKQEVQSNVNELQTSVDNHKNNTNIHVTLEEKHRWDEMADPTGEGINGIISNKFENAKAYTDAAVNNLKQALQNGNIEIPFVNGIRFSIGDAQPSNPEEQKDLWINTTTNRIYFFSNSRWNSLQ